MLMNLYEKNDNKYYIKKEIKACFKNVDFKDEKIEDGKRYIWVTGRLVNNYYWRNQKDSISQMLNNQYTIEFEEPFQKINKVKFIAFDQGGWSGNVCKFEIIEESNDVDLILEMYNTINELKKDIEILKEKLDGVDKSVDSISDHFNGNNQDRYDRY